MIATLRAELLRLRRWPVSWVLVGTWLTLNLTFGYLFNYLAYRSEDGANFSTEGTPAAVLLAEIMPDNALVVLVQGMPMFGGAIVMILAALTVGSGYGWGTWKTVFTMGPRRLSAFGGTLGALGVVLAGLVLVTFALDLLVALGIAVAESQPVTWPGLLESAQGLGTGLLIVGMWSAAGVLLGTLARGPALAVGLGLIWALVVENLLRGVSGLLGALEAVTDVLPGTAAGSLVGALGGPVQSDPGGTPGVMTVLDGAPAAVLLGGYLVLFLAVAITLTTRRDIT